MCLVQKAAKKSLAVLLVKEQLEKWMNPQHASLCVFQSADNQDRCTRHLTATIKTIKNVNSVMFVRVAYKEKERILMNALKRAPVAKAEFSGSGVAPFVGRFGYPFVNVGLLAPPQIEAEAWKFDAPRFWAKENHKIPEIVNYRAGLINSSQKSSVKQPEKVVEIAQEIAMATRPVDIEIELEKAPMNSITPDQWTAPMGPRGRLKSVGQ